MTRRAPLCGLFSLHGAAQTSREDIPCSPRRHLSAFADIFPLGARVHKNTGSEHVIRSLPVMTDPLLAVCRIILRFCLSLMFVLLFPFFFDIP